MNRVYCISNGVMFAFSARVYNGRVDSLTPPHGILLHSEAVFFKNEYDEWAYLKSRYSNSSDSFITYEEIKNDIISNLDIISNDFRISKINKINLQIFFGARFSNSPEGNDTINRILSMVRN